VCVCVCDLTLVGLEVDPVLLLGNMDVALRLCVCGCVCRSMSLSPFGRYGGKDGGRREGRREEGEGEKEGGKGEGRGRGREGRRERRSERVKVGECVQTYISDLSFGDYVLRCTEIGHLRVIVGLLVCVA